MDVNHLQAHVLAHFIKESEEDNNQPKFPFLCLLVSGGNSQIILVKAYKDVYKRQIHNSLFLNLLF